MRKYTLEWYLSQRRNAPLLKISDWAAKKVMTNHFLFDGRGAQANRRGKCTACGARIEPQKAYKGKYTICPRCNTRIKVTDISSEKNAFFQNVIVGYLENYGEYLLWRIFRVTRNLPLKGKPVVHIEEAQMQVLKFPLKQRYIYQKEFSQETCYKNDNGFTRFAVVDGKMHWENWERGTIGGFYGCNIFQYANRVYPYNLKTELKGTPFEYSQLWELAESSEEFNLYKALIKYADSPQLEYIIKLKLYKLASGYIRWGLVCNHNESNIIKFLKLNSFRELDFAIKRDMKVKEFEAYRELVRRNIPYTDKNVKIYRALEWHGSRVKEIEKVMTFESLYEYYKSVSAERKVSFRSFVGDYADHLRDCEFLHVDIHNTMYSKPKNFYELHSRLSSEVAAIKNKELYEKCTQRLATEKEYGYKSGVLSVIVPEKAEEIFTDGKTQNHCVGSYIDRVTDGKSVIVFVRKTAEPNTSYYTMEINPETMTVVQCRGYKNSDMTEEVKAFVEMYKMKHLATLKKKRKAIKAA